MSPLPRRDYARLARYDPSRASVRVDLSDNTNLWGAHPAALERIRRADDDDLARYPELYADTLREAVAERFGVAAECVTTGAGSDDVLDSAFRAVYAPGATLRYAAPTFSMIEPLAHMNGITSRAVPWPEALQDPATLLAGGPDVVYVCRPNNPTGEQTPREWVERLMELRGDDDTLVIVDEAYADFAEDSLLDRAPDMPGLLVARTTSKAYGLAGLRCGFAVGNADLVLEVDKSRGPYKVSRLAIDAAAAAVRDETGWMAGTVGACRQNRSRLRDELQRRGLVPLPSQANFLFVPAPTGRATADALALRDAGIGVRAFTGVPGVRRSPVHEPGSGAQVAPATRDGATSPDDSPGDGEGLRVTVGPWGLMEDFLTALDETFPEIAP